MHVHILVLICGFEIDCNGESKTKTTIGREKIRRHDKALIPQLCWQLHRGRRSFWMGIIPTVTQTLQKGKERSCHYDHAHTSVRNCNLRRSMACDDDSSVTVYKEMGGVHINTNTEVQPLILYN